MIPLPIEDQEGLLGGRKFPRNQKTDDRLAAASPAEDADVLNPFVFPQSEPVPRLATDHDTAQMIPALNAPFGRRWDVLLIAESLLCKPLQNQLDLRSALRVELVLNFQGVKPLLAIDGQQALEKSAYLWGFMRKQFASQIGKRISADLRVMRDLKDPKRRIEIFRFDEPDASITVAARRCHASLT